jgi:hypothetical protein
MPFGNELMYHFDNIRPDMAAHPAIKPDQNLWPTFGSADFWKDYGTFSV